jgi:hypothetical protein
MCRSIPRRRASIRSRPFTAALPPVGGGPTNGEEARRCDRLVGDCIEHLFGRSAHHHLTREGVDLFVHLADRYPIAADHRVHHMLLSALAYITNCTVQFDISSRGGERQGTI